METVLLLMMLQLVKTSICAETTQTRSESTAINNEPITVTESLLSIHLFVIFLYFVLCLVSTPFPSQIRTPNHLFSSDDYISEKNMNDTDEIIINQHWIRQNDTMLKLRSDWGYEQCRPTYGILEDSGTPHRRRVDLLFSAQRDCSQWGLSWGQNYDLFHVYSHEASQPKQEIATFQKWRSYLWSNSRYVFLVDDQPVATLQRYHTGLKIVSGSYVFNIYRGDSTDLSALIYNLSYDGYYMPDLKMMDIDTREIVETAHTETVWYAGNPPIVFRVSAGSDLAFVSMVNIAASIDVNAAISVRLPGNVSYLIIIAVCSLIVFV